MISVVTPTLNPRPELLSRVLKSLSKQSLSVDGWEYILIDNGSDVPLDGRIDLSWHPQARVVVEREKGLTPARIRGFREARGDLIVMVDDDNVLAENYLETAQRMMDRHPFIGALGAYIEGEYLEKPEPWVHEFAAILCDMKDMPEKQAALQYAMVRQGGPWVPVGAGMVIRKLVTDEYMRQISGNSFRSGLDRTGGNLVGSGDADMAYTAIDLGMAIGNTNELRITHLIPPERLTLRYLLRLLYASNYGTARLLVERGWKKEQKPQPEHLMQKIRRSIGRFRKRTPQYQCWLAFSKGYQDGITGRPFDRSFS